MALRIKLKNSVVQDRVPTTSDLPEVGELAVNANINSIGGFMRASDNSVVKIFGPGSLSTPTATTSVPGISELATNSETTTGTATNRVVTPAGLNAVTVAERSTSNSTYLALAGGTLTGVLAATAGSNSAPAIHFGDSDSGIFGGTNTVSLAAGGTLGLSVLETSVRVPTKLGINGAAPQTPLDIIANGSGYAMAVRGRSADDLSQIRFTSNDYGTIFAELESDATYLATRIGGSEKLRVDSLGRLLVGTSSSRGVGETTQKLLQIEGVDASTGFSIVRNGANTAPPFLSFGKQRSGAVGGNTIVQQGDQLGQINFSGADGTDLVSNAASISSFVDGTPGANDMPGRLVFSTTADGAASPTTRMTIKSDGKINFGSVARVEADGVIKAANGDESIPGHSFLNDPDNGMFRATTNAIGFSTGGIERLRIDSSGNVGIGTTAVDGNKLAVLSGGDGVGIYRDFTGSGGAGVVLNFGRKNSGGSLTKAASIIGVGSDNTGTAGEMRFTTSASGTLTERMRIDASGNIGIGTTSPTNKLHVAGDVEFTLGTELFDVMTTGSGSKHPIRLLNADASAGNEVGIQFGPANNVVGASIQGIAESDFTSTANRDGALSFTTRLNGTLSEAMRITSSRRVGIGTSSPKTDLDISNDAGGTLTLSCSDDSSSANQLIGKINFHTADPSGDGPQNNAIISAHSVTNNGSGAYLKFSTATDIGSEGADAVERMRIDSSGNVGIGTSSPGNKLHVEGGVGSGGFITKLFNTVGSGDVGGHVLFLDANRSDTTNTRLIDSKDNKFTVFSNGAANFAGNVGIGTTSPDQTLHVHKGSAGSISSTANSVLTLENSTDAILQFLTPSSNINQIRFGDPSDDGAGFIEYNHSDNRLTFGTAGPERMRINSSGDVFIGKTSSDVNNTGAELRQNGVSVFTKNNGVVTTFNRGTNNGQLISLQRSGNEGGSIHVTTTSASFNSGGSDRSVKKNFEDWTENTLNLFKNLNPQKFNYIIEDDGAEKTKGYIAQDLVDSFPEAYPKNDNDKYMFNPSGMVVYLMKAIQELEAKVAALEAA